MLLFAKIITIVFSFLYIVGVIAPYWFEISLGKLIAYEVIVTVLFLLVTFVASRIARKHDKSVYWFRYLDSFYSKKEFKNKQYIEAIDKINTVYDEESPLLHEVEKDVLVERKKSLHNSLEAGKLSYIKLIPIFVSAVLSYFLPSLQKILSPEFDSAGFIAKLEDMLVSNTNTDVILTTVKEMLPTSSAQDNWNFTACLITIFLMVSVEIIILKSLDLRSECLEYEIEKIESVLQKDSNEKNYENIYVESAYLYLDDYSKKKRKTEKKKAKTETETEIPKSRKDFFSDFDALEKNKQEKLIDVMKEKQLYEIIFKKTKE